MVEDGKFFDNGEASTVGVGSPPYKYEPKSTREILQIFIPVHNQCSDEDLHKCKLNYFPRSNIRYHNISIVRVANYTVNNYTIA